MSLVSTRVCTSGYFAKYAESVLIKIQMVFYLRPVNFLVSYCFSHPNVLMPQNVLIIVNGKFENLVLVDFVLNKRKALDA